MATLNNTKPKDTFASLLKLESNTTTSSLKNVESGDGVTTALSLADDDAKITGTLNVTGATDLDSTLNVDGTVTLASVAADSSEVTGLFLNGSNQVVKRDLDSTAFSSGATNSFATIAVSSQSSQSNVVADASNDTLTLESSAAGGINITTTAGTDKITIASTFADVAQKPTVVLMNSSDQALTTSMAKLAFAAANNSANSNSFTFNSSGAFSLDTGNKRVTVDEATVVKIDVCIFFKVTAGSAGTPIVEVDLYQENSGGSATKVHGVKHTITELGTDDAHAVTFSAVRVADAGSHIYLEVGCQTIGTSSLAINAEGNSHITVTKMLA